MNTTKGPVQKRAKYCADNPWKKVPVPIGSLRNSSALQAALNVGEAKTIVSSSSPGVYIYFEKGSNTYFILQKLNRTLKVVQYPLTPKVLEEAKAKALRMVGEKVDQLREAVELITKEDLPRLLTSTNITSSVDLQEEQKVAQAFLRLRQQKREMKQQIEQLLQATFFPVTIHCPASGRDRRAESFRVENFDLLAKYSKPVFLLFPSRVGGHPNVARFAYFFDPQERVVRKHPLLKAPYRLNSSVVSDGVQLWAVGGSEGNFLCPQAFGEVETLSLEAKRDKVWGRPGGLGSWGEPFLHQPRSSPHVVECEGRVYVLGGRGPGEAGLVSSVERYNSRKKRWEVVSGLPRGIERAPFTTMVAAVVDGKIHVLTVGSRATHHVFDPSAATPSTQWTELDSHATIRDDPRVSVCVVGSKLYVVGFKQAAVYDVEAKKWTALRPPPPRCGAKVVAHEGTLVLVGGKSPWPCFSLEEQKWTPMKVEGADESPSDCQVVVVPQAWLED